MYIYIHHVHVWCRQMLEEGTALWNQSCGWLWTSTWGLGADPGWSARAISSLNHWAILQAPLYVSVKSKEIFPKTPTPASGCLLTFYWPKLCHMSWSPPAPGRWGKSAWSEFPFLLVTWRNSYKSQPDAMISWARTRRPRRGSHRNRAQLGPSATFSWVISDCA